jgi:hypothetical protein
MISASQVYSPESPIKPERPFLQLGGMNVIENDLGVKALGVTAHPIHQIGPHQAFHIAGPVIHLGGGGQLTAHLQSGDQHRLQIGAGGVNGGGIAGGSGAENQQAACFVLIGGSPLAVLDWRTILKRKLASAIADAGV